MSESFSAILRAEADHIWRRIFNHPFLTEVKRGALPVEKFRYYLTQDYLYLEGFARAVAFALARAPDSRTLELLSHRVLTPIERPLHQELMPLVDLSPEDSDRMGRAPTNLAYVNHLLRTAAFGGLGATAAALLPCPWSYHQLARIHRRTSLGTVLEEARGCSSESGIMVLEQKPARKQGAPNRCWHRTNPTVCPDPAHPL